MTRPGKTREAARGVVVAVVVVILAAAATAACGPPPARVHSGPIPTHMFSWEMGRSFPVYDGITEDALARGGPGWDPNSAALNEPGNIVMFGHRVSHGAPFRTLDLLQPGNVITIGGSDGRNYYYRVVLTRITAPNWADVLDWQPSNGLGLTLVACHPPGSLRYRIVVHAERITG